MLYGQGTFKESRFWEHIFSTSLVYQRQNTSGWQKVLQPLSTGLYYIISGQAQQKSSNKTAWLSMISSLINAVLHVLDDAITPAAYWVLELWIPRKTSASIRTNC